MSTMQLLTTGWTWDPGVIVPALAGLAAYILACGISRLPYFLIALALYAAALISPINTLADGYLFSAHMVQHLLLLLLVPPFLLLSLPRTVTVPNRLRLLTHPIAGWIAGAGAMWLWHAPALCNAAVTSRPIHGIQTASLLFLGTIFWWQTLAPRESDRLPPLTAVVYLFSSCATCSVLGIILTFSPITVCAIYMHPVDRLGLLSTIRNDWGMTPQKDQQLGGLLMWAPMCLVYLSAVIAQLVHWFREPAPGLLSKEAS